MIRAGRASLLMAVGGAIFCTACFANADENSPYPSPHTAWTKHDYVDFYFTHWNGNLALPHLRNDTTRDVFDRLVDRENLARFAAAKVPAEDKLADLRLMLSALGEIRAAYNSAVQVGEPLSEELSRVQIFTLDLLDMAVRVSAATAERPSRAWTTILFGVVTSLAERNIYSPAQRRQLCDAFARQCQGLRALLSRADAREFAERIGSLAANESDPALRQSLKRLVQIAAGT